MLEKRSLKLDLLALGLLALTIFLAAALLSYHPADPPSDLVYPAQTETLNLCGRSGALVSATLLTAMGVGAYYLLVSLTVLDSLLLTRQTISQPLLRAGGWLLSLVGVTSLFAMAAPSLSPGPVIGSGGYLGAAGRGVLQMHFASVGAYILAVSLVLGGLLLSTDYVLVRILAWTFGLPVTGLGSGLARVATAYAARLSTAGEDEEEEEDGPAIRHAGRNVEEEEYEEEEEDEYEEDEDEDELEEPASLHGR